MKKLLAILGTRPEVIKLAPVIHTLRRSQAYDVYICNTEQQKELSNQILRHFNLKPDFNLDVMVPNQNLIDLQARITTKLYDIYRNNKFDATIIQGDTMTVLCGANVSFFCKTPVFHVEAGLRSHNLLEPFPEEGIRQMTSRITNLHFAPTNYSRDSLLREGISAEKIAVTGNTGIDSLQFLSSNSISEAKIRLAAKGVVFNDKSVLVTVHRRENHGQRINCIIESLKTIICKYIDHQFVLPVHPNPNVKEKIYNNLSIFDNVILTDPLSYPELIYLIKHAKLIMTDSGGIQEEAPSFGCPVLVLRYETERFEGVDAGFAKLVGSDRHKIFKEADSVLSLPKSRSRLETNKNPYGDGKACQRILSRINSFFEKSSPNPSHR